MVFQAVSEIALESFAFFLSLEGLRRNNKHPRSWLKRRFQDENKVCSQQRRRGERTAKLGLRQRHAGPNSSIFASNA